MFKSGNGIKEHMDSCFEQKHLIEEWALPHYNKIVKEIKEHHGNISTVKKNSLFIEVISQVKNLIRYDQISKNSIITYSLPKELDLDL